METSAELLLHLQRADIDFAESAIALDAEANWRCDESEFNLLLFKR